MGYERDEKLEHRVNEDALIDPVVPVFAAAEHDGRASGEQADKRSPPVVRHVLPGDEIITVGLVVRNGKRVRVNRPPAEDDNLPASRRYVRSVRDSIDAQIANGLTCAASVIGKHIGQLERRIKELEARERAMTSDNAARRRRRP